MSDVTSYIEKNINYYNKEYYNNYNDLLDNINCIINDNVCDKIQYFDYNKYIILYEK